ncbi:retrotransposon-like protein 1 [Microtus ochrogaster]|uniref:Retrotransposon-like protein 1 n=1 Tax=Microtus ochrogaster TaxID=79684 RepID=A0ABM1AKW7_MICOH|nr:retrotransposon-like protein 1 [Microtus ochrogaster]
MMEPSEDSFETMMELKNPSSKQMESSEGSSNTVEKTPGSSGAQAQAEAGSDSGPVQEGEEPPSGPVQEGEEPPSGPEGEEPPSGPVQEGEEPPSGPVQEGEEPSSGPFQEGEEPSGPVQEGEEPSGPVQEGEEIPSGPVQEGEEGEEPSSGPVQEGEEPPSGPIQEGDEPSGPVQEGEEPPSGPVQEGEEPSGPVKEGEEPPSDPVQEGEEPPSGPVQEGEEPSSGPVQEGEEPSGPVQEGEEPSGPVKEGEEPPSDPVQEGEEQSSGLVQEGEEPPSGPVQEGEEPPSDPVQEGEEGEEPSSGSDQEMQELPTDEELSSDSYEESEDSYSDEDLDRTYYSSDPLSEATDGIDSMYGSQANDETDLEDRSGELEGEGQPRSSPEEVMATMGTIISMFLRMQDVRQQHIVTEEILTQAMEDGQLPTIRRFSGDRRDYHEFLVLCQMTMQSHASMFYNDQLRVRFVMRHLSGLALEWANALVEENSPLINDYEGFLQAMSDMFEYRQTLRVAEDAMFKLRQGNRSVADYINEFQSLVPTLGWPDEVLQAHLCHGLNEDIRHYLFRIPQPNSLKNLMVVVLQIEDKLAERRAVLRLPPESRPRNMTWMDSPAPEKWRVSSWLSHTYHPDIDRAHLFLLLMVRVSPYQSVAVQALVDSGAEGNYMDEKFAQEHYVELYEKPYPQAIKTVDGSLIGNEPIWLYTEPLMCIQQNHYEYIEFDIVPSPHYSVVLGIKWLRTHAPDVDWTRGRCTFHSPYCLKNCFHPPPPCIALEKYSVSLLPGLPHSYSDLADVFNPKEADDETSDQPSSDGSDDLSESEPSELQQAGDSDRNDVFYESPSKVPWESVAARMQQKARQQEEYWILYDMLTDRQDYVQMMPELFDQLHGAAWFTKLELRRDIKGTNETYSVSHTEDTWKATFGLTDHQMRCYRPFTLCSFADKSDNEIHSILKDILGFYVICRGQEVLIYSMTQEEHYEHVRQVLLRFRHNNVYCSLDRSQFHCQTAEIMGFALFPKGVKLNKTLMNLITGCPAPGNRRCLQAIIELMYPYRHFVEHFAIIAEPLVRQLLSSAPFYWGEEEQEALECLKRAFRKSPILYHPKPQNPFYLETGITGSSLYASLIQTDEETGKKATCAFYSRKLSPMEVDYPQVELRILPIRASFMVWSRYLENTEEPIMILLNTEDLASLNNDRLTVLLPGHWVFFFSHFHFDVMELPDQDDTRALSYRRSQNQRGFRGRFLRPLLLLALRGGQRDLSSESQSEDSEDESYQESAELNRQSLVQELLSTIPIEQIFNSFLAQINMAQVRAFVYNFFYCLLRWKSVVSVAALLVIMRVKRQQVSPLPGPSLEVDYPPPRHTLRLILDSSLIAGSGMVTALIQLFSQMPPLLGANTIPARQLAEMFIRPRCWQRNALHSQPPRGLRFTPGFWFTLCHFFGIRANPEEDVFPGPHERRYLELHVVGDEDVVLREALQDDLQRYRQCGLHDGLQDTSQDAQDNDVQEALLGDQEAVTFRPQDLLDPEVLAFLNNRLLYILGADGRLTLISRDEVAQALTRFLIMASRIRPPPPPSNTLSSSDDELD